MKLGTLGVLLTLTLTLSLLVAPVPTEAQEKGKVYRIGWLSPSSRAGAAPFTEAILRELRDLGWVEGQNLIIEWRFAEGRLERLPNLASELVRLKPDLIFTASTLATQAATQTTRTIPIMFTFVGDPVRSGLVASLARPGGNVTGLATVSPDLAGKMLELLKETIPELSRIAILWNPTNPGLGLIFREARMAAEAMGMTVQPLEVRDLGEIEAAFSAMTKERAEALVELSGSLTLVHRHRIADLTLENRVPGISWNPRFVRAGGLMSYAPNYLALMQRAAHYLDRILKGAKPADLPVEQPTKFELVVNLKTAKALGLTIPQSVLIRADEVIE